MIHCNDEYLSPPRTSAEPKSARTAVLYGLHVYDDLEAVMQVEARSQEMAEREAIDAFIEDLDDDEDDFEELDSDSIRAAISYRTYIGSLRDEPLARTETKVGG